MAFFFYRLSVQDVFRAERLKLSILRFEDHRPALMRDDLMPAASLDRHGAVCGACGDGHLFRQVPLVVIKILGRASSQDHDHFRRRAMAVDGQDGARFERVQHTLRVVVGAGAQIVVHPQPRRSLRLRGEGVE